MNVLWYPIMDDLCAGSKNVSAFLSFFWRCRGSVKAKTTTLIGANSPHFRHSLSEIIQSNDLIPFPAATTCYFSASPTLSLEKFARKRMALNW
ncbi:hypothetical protein CEXT_185801 [Caerostris extrusa]|uniref:Uncharacterized protein n=1 Tax=Caerostris extrusa TaxID=172846 RepID=A0AAV4XJ14_CAEEX|nr:hypothetical protein CEXT_185801 [Caerostris extrusa]